MNEVYADPYSIPWNVVPRDHDVVQRVAGDRRVPADARILDLGCGYGKNATALEELGRRVYGVDIATSAVARCRRLVQNPGRFLVASAIELPWADRVFDAVMDVGCLHCLDDESLHVAVTQINRVLRPGGLLFSRIFQPKDRAWLDAQPFSAARFGLRPDEAAARLGAVLEIDSLDLSESASYFTCRLRNDRHE
jgi:SAM-dependent methyltransferase